MKDLRIIIIDDHRSYRTAIKELLLKKYKSWTIDEAGDEEGLLKIEDFQYADLILMDVVMPGINGIELTKKVLRVYSDLKIVASSLFIEDLHIPTVIEAGFKGCISKQFLLRDLEDCISTVLGGSVYYPEYSDRRIFY
jgi:DNA-binding NarL/FixJ family response regulator